MQRQEDEFRVGGLPQKEIRNPLLAGCADDEVGVGQVGSVKVTRKARPIQLGGIFAPGADGFGTIKAGALERSNVDITEELVNLITAQRNFQANAKAIETTTTLSQTIIQIRG